MKLIRLAPLEIQNKLFSMYAYFARISAAKQVPIRQTEINAV
jgi:hypothetical protein